MRLMFPVAAAFALGAGAAMAADAPPPTLYGLLGSPDGWTISGTFRIRDEAIADQFRPAPAPRSDHFVSLRTTLFAEYDAGSWRVGGEVFDSRGYDERPDSSVGTTEVDALELSQAYVSIDVGGHDSAITAGRFAMDDGSRRLISRSQFRNTINAFTGIRYDWKGPQGVARVFWVMPQVHEPDGAQGIRDNDIRWDRESPDFEFYGGSYTWPKVLGGTLEVYGYGLAERDSPRVPTRNRRLFTPGVRLYRAPKAGAFDYEVEGIYQTGKARGSTKPTDLKDLDVEAHFIHLEAGRSFTARWSPRVAVQYDQASGDEGKAGRFTRFDTLFGARRGEYGPTSLWGAVQRANLSSPAIRLEVTPDKRWDGLVAWRGLWLENPKDSFASTAVRDTNGLSGRHAGDQLEARVRYWVIPKAVRLEGGAAWLFKGRFLDTAPNAPKDGDSRYGYVDLTFTF